MKIISIRLEPMFTWGGKVAQYKIHATTEDGIEHPLFSFYTDEKHYTNQSFVGFTLEQARAKFTSDDVAYLRS